MLWHPQGQISTTREQDPEQDTVAFKTELHNSDPYRALAFPSQSKHFNRVGRPILPVH